MRRFAILCLFSSLLANPTGPVFLKEGSSCQSNGKLLEVIAPDQSVIDWQTFSIAIDETTRFIQPDISSIVLNRVKGHEISLIDGLLEANGRVVLVNPNGIILSSTGIIQAADFIASTYDLIDPSDFSINRSEGKTSLNNAIQLNGIIRSTEMKNEGGKILLVARDISMNGQIESPKAAVEIFGNQIELNGMINVNSPFGGGTVTIGDENTSLLQMNRESSIRADALVQGDGGRIELWGDLNCCYGNLSSRGGEEGGDGGFVEISGHELFFDGLADRRAPKGSAGMLYLDPTNITIGGATSGGPIVGNPLTWTGPSPVNVTAFAIGSALDLGDVTINTTNGVSPDLGEAGIITLLQTFNVNWTLMPSVLTLIADSAISIQGEILSTSGSLIMNAPTVNIGAIGNTSTVNVNIEGSISISCTDLNFATDDATGTFLASNDFLNFDIANNFNVQAIGNGAFELDCSGAIASNPSQINVGNDLICDGIGGGGYEFDFDQSLPTFNIGRDFILTTDDGDNGLPTLNSGAIINVGRDMQLSSDGSGSLTINSSGSTCSVNVGRDLSLIATSTGFSALVAGQNLNVNVGNDILLENTFIPATFPGSAFAGGSAINAFAGGSIEFGQQAQAITFDGSIFLQADQNVIFGPESRIDTFGSAVTSITIVVDNQAPSAPQIGDGSFVMDATSIFSTAPDAPIQFFTARQNQNSILGTINGFSFSPGPFNINTETEQWSQYYPQSFAGSPFTVFYKEPQLSSIVLADSGQTLGTVNDLLEEFASPLPFYDVQFCIQYEGEDFAKNLYQKPISLKTLVNQLDTCPWVQVDNYRKYYPSLQRWGYVHLSD